MSDYRLKQTTSEILDQIFVDLGRRCDGDGYTFADENDLDRWSAELQVRWTKALDIIGVELAKRYHRREVGYEFGDTLANDLEAILMNRSQQVENSDWPRSFWEVYLAFDSGEFHRSSDDGADPIIRYTDPAIAEIVTKLD